LYDLRGFINMDWLKVTIFTDDIDGTCAALSALGHDQFEIDDPDEFDEFIKNRKPFWQLVDENLAAPAAKSVSVYLPENADLSDFSEFEFTQKIIRNSDWEDNWKQYYRPIKIGRRILIQPEWEPFDDTEGRVVFLCDPGVSFGTGTHATTRMCLEYLDEIVETGDTVTDLGCGSGILSAVAILLGAERARAFDIDPLAVGAAEKNARLNNAEVLAEQADLLMDCALWERLHGEPADIVCANLVADLITALAGKLGKAVKKGGSLIISGVLEEDAERVCETLEREGLRLLNRKSSEGWTACRLSADN
jgi:ribosomal protein L11 methyltransferase